MQSGYDLYFDLTKLLKQDYLKTRSFAESERAPSASDYFSMLSKFLDIEQDVNRALDMFSRVNASIDDCKILDRMITLLEDIGCEKFILDFHILLDAYGKKGNWREAAALAKQIKEDITKFYKLINSAKTRKKPDVLSGNDLSLRDLIQCLDDEELSRKPVILAVDDSPAILQSISAVLSGDYKVYTLPKPEELEKVLQNLVPDLFLLDYMMPGINGFDLVPIIRGYPEHKETPIIFLTSEGTVDTVTAAVMLGASDFTVKPFRVDQLREKIAKHIVKKKAF